MKPKILILLTFLTTSVFSQDKAKIHLSSKDIEAIKTEVLTHINDFRKVQKLPLFYIDKITTQNAQNVSEDLLKKDIVKGEIPIECGTIITYLTYQEVQVNLYDKSKPYISNIDYVFMGIAGALSDWKPKDNNYHLGIGISEYPDKQGIITLAIIASTKN